MTSPSSSRTSNFACSSANGLISARLLKHFAAGPSIVRVPSLRRGTPQGSLPRQRKRCAAHDYLRVPGVKSTTSAAGFLGALGALVRRPLVRGWVEGIFDDLAGQVPALLTRALVAPLRRTG